MASPNYMLDPSGIVVEIPSDADPTGCNALGYKPASPQHVAYAQAPHETQES